MAAHKKENAVQTIAEKEKLCLQSRKHINNLVDIITLLHSEKRDVAVASATSLQNVFEKFLECEEMGECGDEGNAAEKEYRGWLRQQYNLAVAGLLSRLAEEDKHIQKTAVCALMKFIASEGRHPLRGSSAMFPETLFSEVIEQMTSNDQHMDSQIDLFQEYLRFDDVRYQTLKILHKELQKSKQNKTDVYLTNIFCILERCSSKKCRSKFLALDTAGKMGSQKEHTKLFTATWLAFLTQKLTPALYKKVLIIIKDKVMPKLSNPLVLSDFLTQSYSVGGVISLLALDGLFILINKHNLEYPEFYEKLYALLEPAVFHVKYRSRFFHLADLFLSSTHLPSYLVAAFAKKLSRISLTAPASVLPVTIIFILNLLKRHSSCKVLINRTDAPQDLDEDPYLYDEPDPAKCQALTSSLWEIKSLQHHYCPLVSQLSSRINNPLHVTEDMLGDFLDISEGDLMEKEIKKKRKTIPVTFAAPQGLLGTKEDRLKMHWVLQ